MGMVAEEPHRESPAEGRLQWEFGEEEGGAQWVLVKPDFLVKCFHQSANDSGKQIQCQLKCFQHIINKR